MSILSKKQLILDASLHLFIKQGISETSTASIAEYAGVANGTLFHHFKNKKQLVEALYFSLKQDLVNDLGLGKKIENTHDAYTVWRDVVYWGIEQSDKFGFFSLYYASQYIDEKFRENALSSIFSFLSDYIEQQKDSGLFIPAPTDLVAQHIQQNILNAVTYISQRTVMTSNEIEMVIDASFELCFFGALRR